MGEFKRDRKFGRRNSSRPSYRGGGRFSRDSDRPERRDFGRSNRNSERQMHEVICDKCGERCEVPFKPTEGKPVYCSDCFRKNETGSRNKPQFAEEFDKINKKLDKILESLDVD